MIVPHFDQNQNHSHALVGPTRSGKTYGMAQILLRPEFASRKVYVFSLNAQDASIALLKQRKNKSKTIFVDLEKIGPDLDLKRDVSPDAVLVMDDVLELPRSDEKRQALLKLMNETLSRGRHHKSSKNSPGCSVMFCGHAFRGGRDLAYVWREVPYLTVYPSSSRHRIRDFLTKSLQMHRNDLDRIFELSEGSRSITFHIHKPMYACWDTGIVLL